MMRPNDKGPSAESIYIYISPKPTRASTPVVLPKPQEGVYMYGSQIRDEGLGATILGGT